MRGTRKRAGYTLFELALACTVLVVVAGVSVPVAQSLFARPRVAATDDFIRARWAEARSLAQEEGRPYRFCVRPNSGQFRIAPDSPEFWDGGSLTSATDNIGTVKEGVLEEEVQFTGLGTGAAEDWVEAGCFLPDGTAREDVEIAFGRAGERTNRLRLRAASGAVTTVESP